MPKTHYSSLQQKDFDNIVCWKKTIEVRLFDEKRQAFDVWDTLIFSCWEDLVSSEIIVLHRYTSFKDMIDDNIVYKKLWAENPKLALNDFYTIYTPEQEKYYGVVWIEIVLHKSKSLKKEVEFAEIFWKRYTVTEKLLDDLIS